MQPRIHGFPEQLETPLWIFENDSILKSHRSYKAAKSGNMNAAVRLVTDLAFQFLKDSCEKIPPGACFVAPHAREATGNNAIPQVLATAAATLSNGTTDLDIVQIHQVFHTGADPMERLANRPEFEGLVTPGPSSSMMSQPWEEHLRIWQIMLSLTEGTLLELSSS